MMNKPTYDELELQIARLKDQNESLAAKLEFHELLIENSNSWETFRDQEGKIIYVSPSFEDIMHFSREDYISGKVNLFDFVHPDDLNKAKEVFQKQLNRHSFTNIICRVYNNHRTLKYISVASKPVFNNQNEYLGFRTSIVDITEQKQREQVLIENEEKYRNFVKHSPNIIYKYSNKKGGLFWSDRVKEILGYNPDEIIDNPFLWNNSIHPDDKIAVQKAIEDYEKGEDYNIEYRIYTKSRKLIWLHDYFMHKTSIGDEIIIEGQAIDITERKQNEILLNESKEKYRLALLEANRFADIMENIPSYIYIKDLQHHYIYANSMTLNLFKGSKDKLPYNYDIEVFPKETVEKLWEIDNQVFENGIITRNEVEIKTEDNRSTFFLEIKYPLYNEQNKIWGLCGISTDITEIKLIEASLSESENRLRLATNAGNIGVWDWDILKNDLKWDDSMFMLYGISKSDFSNVYEAWTHTIHPDDREYVEGEIQAALTGEREYSPEFRIILPSGEVRVIKSASQTFRNNDGNPVRMTGTNINITERKQTEILIQQQNLELKKLNTDKDRFISILAHDLKNPFSALLGFSGLLVKNVHSYDIDKIENQVKVINDTVIRSFTLLEDILLWASVQTGKIPFESRAIKFSELCREVIESLQSNAKTKNISVNHISTEEIKVTADVNMLKTILRNLISNAIKFTNVGGKIDIAIDQFTDFNIITISDNGIGISPNKLETLFNISQIKSTTGTANETGTGLGLLLCKELVEKHGGKIWAESEVDKGSKFMLSFPVSNV